MKEMWQQLEGKRTHILVLGAIFFYLISVINTPNGLFLSTITAKDLSYIMLIGCISTGKIGIEKAIRGGSKVTKLP